MGAIISRRNFMLCASVAALAAGSVMLTGCGIVDGIVEDVISKEYSDDIKLGKYTVAGADARACSWTKDSNGNTVIVAIAIDFNVFDGNDLKDKSSASLISDITIDGTSVSSVSDSDLIEVDSETILGTTLSSAYVSASYKITPVQSKAFFENGKELKFTVTLADKSAIYTLTYDKSKENSDSDPITSKATRKN